MANNLASLFAQAPRWVLGLMSGTSLDGVDAALIQTDGETLHALGAFQTIPYASSDRQALKIACEDAKAWGFDGPHPASFQKAEQVVTEIHAEAVRALLAQTNAPKPALIGFHGQTLLHRRPEAETLGASLQIGDGQALADALGIPVVYDLRRADIEAGGEGAPLAPAYHSALMRWSQLPQPCAFLNIGGVANISWCDKDGALIAFDTGPGNGPIDEWVSYHGFGDFDRDGLLAASGSACNASIAHWMNHAYFQAPAPKSLDRGDFSAALAMGLELEDGAASLTSFAARTIIMGVESLPQRPECVIISGGGRHNATLIDLLRNALDLEWLNADAIGLRGDAIEAEAFAFLAVRSVREWPLSYPGTTGVPAPLSGGVLAWPNKS